MKKLKRMGKKFLSFLCAVVMTVSMFFPSISAQAAEENEQNELSVTDVKYESGAIVFSFNLGGDELYTIVQQGLKVLVGEKEISYEPNYSFFSYNEKGTYIKNGNSIYFYPSDFEEGDNIVTLSTDDQTLKVGVRKTVTGTDYFGDPNSYEIERFDVPVEEPEPVEEPGENEGKEKTLFIRLVGSFESKMVGEEDIDAISGATSVSYLPENTNSVKLQAALVDYAISTEQVGEEDWHELSFFDHEEGGVRVNDDPTKTRVVIEPECPGVEGSYNVFTGDVILSGKPEVAGVYKVYVEFTDTEGRTAVSNQVDFTVHSTEEKLSECLKLENCTQTADGLYIYDQDPWYIRDFGADTIVVPREIKAWYGSHTMGTYSEVGEIISLTNGQEPSQTLVIPEGCNLTMVNVRVHSGVRIVVQAGAKFSIRQSTLEGIVEVENGGCFSCDYVDYGENAGFIYGSTINGQLRLKDGATIENARIISHTNYSARDDENRRNQEPVVTVKGNVNVKGDVYILADEAPNGSYGQTGLLVKGTLNIPEGSTVAVYGGGSSNLTAKGGDAIVMDSGLIQGDGNLIAVGGFGMNLTADRSILGGGAAISGKGNLDVKNIYVEGGSSFDAQVEPIQGNIGVSTRSSIIAKYGKTDGLTSENYWHGTGDNNTVPAKELYFPETDPSEVEPKEPATDERSYKDGTYIGVGHGKKGEIKLSVTIKDAQVEKIEEVSQNETPSFWESAKALIETIIARHLRNAEVDSIDGISGATLSSNGIKEAVKDAFEQAAKAAEDEEDTDISGVSLKGTGTWSDPYQIGSVKELLRFAQNVDEGTKYSGEYVALTKDLDLSKIENFNTVGTEDGFSIFAGNFDGQGHVIKNVTIKAEKASNAGFFTALNSNASVKDLKLENVYIEATGDYSLYVGILAGNIKKSAVINHCQATGQIELKSDSYTIEAGGIVGNMMLKSAVINCYSDVKINAELAEEITADLGAVAGLSKMNSLVLNCAAKGEIVATTSTKVQAGGIIGNALGKTQNVVASVNIQSNGSNGAVFGVLDSFGSAQDYYTIGTGLKPIGNTDEQAREDALTLQQLNSNISSLHKTYNSYDFYKWEEVDSFFKPSDEQWHEVVIDAAIFDGGSGTADDPYRIATKEQLVAFAASLDTEILYDGKFVELVNDIDISDIANWEPIGGSEFAFNGNFNGNGHTISGLKEGTADAPRKLSTQLSDFSNAIGLFGTLGVDAVVNNIKLTGVEIYVYRDDASFVGGIAGYMQGLTDENSRKGAIIDNCYVQGKIYSTTHEKNAYVGGIAARQYKGAIINCHTDVDLRSTVEYGESIASVGGITGMTNRGLVANCYSTGKYFGSMARDIENEIEGMSSVGGLVGVDAGDLVNSYSSGDTVSEHYSIYTGAVTGWVTGIGKAYQSFYDKTKTMTIAGRKEAEVQPYGTKTVGGVNEEGVAYEGGVVDGLEPFTQENYPGIADKLNGNFSSFAIDVTRYGIGNNSLRTWTYRDGVVAFSDEYATITYVQPEAEKVPVVPLVMRDGTWYGRDSKAIVTVKIMVKDGEVISEEILTGSKDDTENYEKARARAESKAIYGDKTGYGAGDPSVFAGGDGSKENPYLITDEHQLRYIAEAICEDETWEGKYFKQTKDISLSSEDFMPIGFAIKAKIKGDPVLYSAYPFRGNFDGAGHTITGLRIGDRTNPAAMYTAAMFGFTGGDYESNLAYGDDVLKVELKNIHLRDVYINNEVPYDTYTAGLVGTGQNGVFIDNCSVTGKIAVKADDIASRGAGLAASMLRGLVTNSWTDVTISAITEDGDVYAGGLFSVTNRINAINCYTLGDVYGTANTNNKVHIGGLTGMAGAFQYNCYAYGNVTSSRPTIDIGIADGRIANVAYDRNCYFNSDARLTENGVVLESVYTGADGTGCSKDSTFARTKEEIGSQSFADLLNKNVDNVAAELEASDKELDGIMSIYYKGGPQGLRRWTISKGKAVFADSVEASTNAPAGSPASSTSNEEVSGSGAQSVSQATNPASGTGNNNVLGAKRDTDKKKDADKASESKSSERKTSERKTTKSKTPGNDTEKEAASSESAATENSDVDTSVSEKSEIDASANEVSVADSSVNGASDSASTDISNEDVPLSSEVSTRNPISPIAVVIIIILAGGFVAGGAVIKQRFVR